MSLSVCVGLKSNLFLMQEFVAISIRVFNLLINNNIYKITLIIKKEHDSLLQKTVNLLVNSFGTGDFSLLQ